MTDSATGVKESLRSEMLAARERTLWLLDQVAEEFLRKRVHSFYSPIGWHFGHIARTEEHWILCEALGRPCLDEHYTFLFADLPENPKDNRVNLPSRQEIIDYLGYVQGVTQGLLESTSLDPANPFLREGYAWNFALEHECQHQETICELLQLIQFELSRGASAVDVEPLSLGDRFHPELLQIPGGEFSMGTDAYNVYDNEQRAHRVEVGGFEMMRAPVTASQWTAFMADSGYSRQDLWSEDGWCWRCAEGAEAPEYWVPVSGGWAYVGPRGVRAIHRDEPVSCVSWFEAEAFANWAGLWLPTEEEWEYARTSTPQPPSSISEGTGTCTGGWGREMAEEAACSGMRSWGPEPVGSYAPNGFGLHDMAGNVWEWTASPFLPYPGFEAFPYDGYSKDHMRGLHKVCRGGSWASSPRILRSTFRNWYVPTYRQGFLGLRLAR